MRIRLSELREIFQKVIFEEVMGNKKLNTLIVLGKTYMIPFGDYDPSDPEMEDVYSFRLLFDELASRSGAVGEFYEDLTVNAWEGMMDLNEENRNELFADVKQGNVYYSIKGTAQIEMTALSQSRIVFSPLIKLILDNNKEKVKSKKVGETLELNVGIIEWGYKLGSNLPYSELKKQAKKENIEAKKALFETGITLTGTKHQPVLAVLKKIKDADEKVGFGSWSFSVANHHVADVNVFSLDKVKAMDEKENELIENRMSDDIVRVFFAKRAPDIIQIKLPNSKLHRFTMMKKSQRRDSIKKNLDAQLKIRRMQDKLSNISRWLGDEEDATMVSLSDLENISNAIDDVDEKSSKRRLKPVPEQE